MQIKSLTWNINGIKFKFLQENNFDIIIINETYFGIKCPEGFIFIACSLKVDE